MARTTASSPVAPLLLLAQLLAGWGCGGGGAGEGGGDGAGAAGGGSPLPPLDPSADAFCRPEDHNIVPAEPFGVACIALSTSMCDSRARIGCATASNDSPCFFFAPRCDPELIALFECLTAAVDADACACVPPDLGGWPLDCTGHCEAELVPLERCLSGESAFVSVTGCELAWTAEQPDDPSAGCQAAYACDGDVDLAIACQGTATGSTCTCSIGEDVRDGGDHPEQGAAACAAAAAHCGGG